MPLLRQPSVGRHDLARVPEQPGGLAIVPTSAHAAEVGVVAVADPFDPQRRVRASARIDLLDRERRGRRISEAGYLVGREVEAAFEHIGRMGGGGQWLEGDRVDAAAAHELAIVLGVERARGLNAFLGFLVRNLGRQDTRLLWLVLGERASFPRAALAFGRVGVRGVRYTMDRFRDALAALAEAKAARGRVLR
jgi:hypothetical protein